VIFISKTLLTVTDKVIKNSHKNPKPNSRNEHKASEINCFAGKQEAEAEKFLIHSHSD
jgi:hypothetical protein